MDLSIEHAQLGLEALSLKHSVGHKPVSLDTVQPDSTTRTLMMMFHVRNSLSREVPDPPALQQETDSLHSYVTSIFPITSTIYLSAGSGSELLLTGRLQAVQAGPSDYLSPGAPGPYVSELPQTELLNQLVTVKTTSREDRSLLCCVTYTEI